MKQTKTLEETKRKEKVLEKRDSLRLSKFRKYLGEKLKKLRGKR